MLRFSARSVARPGQAVPANVPAQRSPGQRFNFGALPSPIAPCYHPVEPLLLVGSDIDPWNLHPPNRCHLQWYDDIGGLQHYGLPLSPSRRWCIRGEVRRLGSLLR